MNCYQAFLSLSFLILFPLHALNVKGTITTNPDGAPAEFGTILIPEARIKARIQPDGSYALRLPSPGSYEFIIRSPGYSPLKTTLTVDTDRVQNFRLSLTSVRGAAVKIRAQKDIQKISLNTLTIDQIKDAPATFGDSINALATLPGVIRPGVFLGPLIVRGVTDRANRYFIDDIPVPNPQHFGGFQSIISNDLIKDIDLYSSAFPAYFGNVYGAVIDINTIDEVKEFGGFIDVSIISSNFLLKSPWGKSVGGNSEISSQNKTEKISGYWITAARIAYLSVMVPPLYRLITGEELASVPEYYDYQLKGKVFLDQRGHWSLTMLAFGSYDTFRFIRNLNDEERARELQEDPTADPDATRFSNDVTSHSQGVYLDYRPSPKFFTRNILYHTLTHSRFFLRARNGPTEESGRGAIDVTNKPNILGLKNRSRLSWWSDIADLKASFEASYFYFTATGTAQQRVSENFSGTGRSDRSSDVRYNAVPLNFRDANLVLSSSVDQKFQIGTLQIVPGVRVDHLSRSRETAIGPRGLIAWEAIENLTFSAAGGQYHSFPQVNTFLFNQPFNQQPQVTVADYLRSEKAWHRTLGAAFQWKQYEFKLEGFSNIFYDQVQPDTSISGQTFANTASADSRGIEVLLRKEGEDTESGDFYGWISYTWNEARRSLNGIKVPFQFEQTHSLKAILGYKRGIHNFGARFEVYSGYPYTPIVGSECVDPCSGELIEYTAIYDTNNPYSARYPFIHRLDLRYTQTRDYTWGSFRWYIEVINVYNMKPVTRVEWDNRAPFSQNNPRLASPDFTLSLIPNFGLEWKF